MRADTLRQTRFYLPSMLLFLPSLAATVYFCRSMGGGMVMPGGWRMSMIWMRMPGEGWAFSIGMFLLMWMAMMIAMMLPSALPMLSRLRPERFALLPACGYFAFWLVVGLVVYGAGMTWAEVAMRRPALSEATPALTGAMLLLSGAFQLSRWKADALARCGDPLRCFGHRGRQGRGGELTQGLRLGWSCGICCAGPMAALLALGMMNPWVMLTVAAVVTLEKLMSDPRLVVTGSGLAAMIAGVTLIAGNLA